MISKKSDPVVSLKFNYTKLFFFLFFLGTLLPLYAIFTWQGNFVRYSKLPTISLFIHESDCSTKLFVFGVTYEPNHERARVADRTWVKILKPEGITWYSNQTDPFLKTKVIIPKEGMGYANVFWRMRLIWEDVIRNNPGYDWYMRVWDDNYVRWDRLCPLLKVYNSNAKLELGHIYTGHAREEFLPDMDHLIGGGATSLSTKSSNEDLLSFMDKCVSWIQDLPPRTNRNNTCRWNCEDYYLSYCRLRLGTRLIDVPGFFHTLLQDLHGVIEILHVVLSCLIWNTLAEIILPMLRLFLYIMFRLKKWNTFTMFSFQLKTILLFKPTIVSIILGWIIERILDIILIFFSHPFFLRR